MPHKSGNVYVYDSPRSMTLDYDSPPALYSHGRDSQSTVSTGSWSGQLDMHTDYDVPPTADASSGRSGIHSSMFGAVYDSPPSLLQTYDVPPSVGVDSDQVSLSNRSSVLSVISNDSRSSIASLRSGSSPSTSARSSADVSFRDVYDTPRASADVTRIAAARGSSSKLLSGAMAADRDSYLEDYAVPRNTAALSNASDSGSSVSDMSAKGLSAAAVKVTSSTEEQDFYDIPRNQQQAEDSCDYDVPAVSHSGSKTSLTKYASTSASGTRQSTESVGQSDVFHRQIVARHDAILRSIERLTDLAKKEVRGDAKHWCSLITTTGLSLRTALKELLNLGKVADSNVDSVVASRLCQQCQPLLVIHASISQCLETLLAMSPLKGNEARCFGSQDLTNLTELVDRLHPLVNEFCVFLHSNAADICRLSVDNTPPAAAASPVVGRRQAPAVKPKPNVSQRTPPPTDVQQRPLPVPPSLEKASTQPAVGKQNTSLTYDDYDYISISREVESSAGQQAVSVQPAVENLQRSASTHPPPTDPSKRCAVINGAVDQPVVLNSSDSEMIAYYAAQVRAHMSAVESAVGEFCRQSTSSDIIVPEAFVEMSKQVVVAGHKLVYIGDTVARHITDNNVCNHIATAANVLCDCLKSVVVSTKEAVLAVPSSDRFHMHAVDCAKSALAACKQLCDVIGSYAGHS